MKARLKKSSLYNITLLLLLLPLGLPLLYFVSLGAWNIFSFFIVFPNFLRTLIFQILVELAFISYLFLALREKKYAPFFSTTHWWLIAGAIILTFTSLISLDPRASFFSDSSRADGLFFLFHVGLYVFLLSWVIKEKATLEIFFKAAIGAGLLTLFLTTLLSLPWFNGSGFVLTNWDYRNFSILFGNQNFAAHYLLLLFSFNGYLILTHPRVRYFIIAAILLIFITFALSAGAFLLSFLLFFILLFITSKKYFYALSATGSLVFLYGAVTAHPLFLRMFSIAGGFLTRFEVWEKAVKTVLQTHPFIGFGWGNGELVWNFAASVPPAFFVGKYYEYIPFDKMHNVLVEFFVGAGFLGLLFLVLFWGRVLWISFLRFWKNYKKIWLFFLLAFSSHLLFLMVSLDTLMSYVLMSLPLAGFILFAKEQRMYLPATGRGAIIGVIAIVMIDASLIRYVHIPAAKAYLLTKKAYYATIYTPHSDDPAKKKTIFQLLDKALILNHPYDQLSKDVAEVFKSIPQYFTITSQERFFISQNLTRLYQELLRNHPSNPSYSSDLAYVELVKGDLEMGEKYLKEALLLAPKHPLIRFRLVSVLIASNKLGEASDILYQLSREGLYKGKTDFYLAIIDFKEGGILPGEEKILGSLAYFSPVLEEWNLMEQAYRMKGTKEELTAFYQKLFNASQKDDTLRANSINLRKKGDYE